MEPSKTSLAAYLEKWLSHVEPSIAPRTFERYQEIARKNLVPLLGQIFLTKLRPEQIATAYARALKTGRRDGAGGLSPRTVHHLHRVLKQALAVAVRWRILTYNPVDAVDPPTQGRAKQDGCARSVGNSAFARPLSWDPHVCPCAARSPMRTAARRDRCPPVGLNQPLPLSTLRLGKRRADSEGRAVQGNEARSSPHRRASDVSRRRTAFSPPPSGRKNFYASACNSATKIMWWRSWTASLSSPTA